MIGIPTRNTFCIAYGLGCLRRKLIRGARENPTSGCQFDRAFTAIKERRPNSMFQRLDLARKRRLRHVQAFCRATVIHVVDDSEEATELDEGNHRFK